MLQYAPMQPLSDCRCVEAVISFLAEALSTLSRRPHHFWEVQQSLLASSNQSHGRVVFPTPTAYLLLIGVFACPAKSRLRAVPNVLKSCTDLPTNLIRCPACSIDYDTGQL